MQLGFEHSYATLPDRFYVKVRPTPVANPQLVAFNRALAADLRLDPAQLASEAAAVFSGNQLPEDAHPLAMAYAGHQFAHFVPQLGDGRAILLGELRGRDGVLRDVQLKGSGVTAFSRSGDGRAALGPMMREYLISEAMHAFGIPTTRSLAVVTTGENVLREEALPGAILTRVAASHVRVGTFEYFAARGDTDAVKELLNYVIVRHYPQAKDAPVPAIAVLQAVAARQAALVANWMRVGFIHGVMNTDNMAISGETIDYGPCAFMDTYDPKTVFSSIDRRGRYAYANQPAIAQWNLARLAETLLPLIDADAEKALKMATDLIESFVDQFNAQFVGWLRRKIGLATEEEGDGDLINKLLAAMQAAQADFTLTFRALTDSAPQAADTADSGSNEAADAVRKLFADPAAIDAWLADWRARIARDSRDANERLVDMRSANPAFIPRNHRVEAALNAASEHGDLAPFNRLLEIVRSPYEEQPEAAEYRAPPAPDERVLQTFCGT